MRVKLFLSVGWFYDMSIFVRLFYTKASQTVMVPGYIQYKNVFFKIILNR